MDVLHWLTSEYCFCGGRFKKIDDKTEVCDRCGLKRISVK